jgi:hypothetical protein
MENFTLFVRHLQAMFPGEQILRLNPSAFLPSAYGKGEVKTV